MGTLKSSRKNLRIGVVQNGRLVDDRVFRHGDQVTVGFAADNTIVLPAAGVPEKFPLLTSRRHTSYLHFTDEMKGTLQLPEGVAALDTLRAKSETLRDGSHRFPLDERVRGKLAFGDTTLLFQFVAQPATRPAFTLARIRQLDPIFSAILGLSAVIHTLFMVHAMAQPMPAKMNLEEVPPDVFRKWVIVPPKPKVEPPQARVVAVAPRPRRAPANPPMPTPERPPAPEVDPQTAARERVNNSTLIVAIRERREGSALDRIFTGDAPTLETFKESGAAPTGAYQVATTGPASGLRTGGGPVAGEIASTGPISERAEVRVAAKERRTPKPILETLKMDGKGDAGQIGEALKRYMGAVTACYEQALKLDPTMGGKYYLEFTIEQSGRVSDTGVRTQRGVANEVFKRCLEGRMVTWKFPVPEGEPVDISVPVVLTPKESL